MGTGKVINFATCLGDKHTEIRTFNNNSEPHLQGYRGNNKMKKSIVCTLKDGKQKFMIDELQCFVADWGMEIEEDENRNTTIYAPQDELDGLLENEKWVMDNFNVTRK